MQEEKGKLGRLLGEAEVLTESLLSLCGSGQTVFREANRAFDRLTEHVRRVYVGMSSVLSQGLICRIFKERGHEAKLMKLVKVIRTLF